MFRDLTIRTKLAGTLAFLIFTIISVSILFVLQMQKMQQTMAMLEDDTIPSLAIAKQIPTQILSLRRYELAVVLFAQAGNKEKVLSDLENFNKALKEADDPLLF